MEILDRIKETVYPIVEKEGAEVTDITYKREGGAMVLRILLDKPSHITIGECGKINNELSERLDEANIIEEHYVIEVSSPGLDRPIIKRRDFERVLGKDIRVSTYGPIDGKNVFIGKLLGIGDLTIVVEDKEGISTEIELKKIARAKLEIAF